MAQMNRRKKNSFRKFESFLTRVILGELAGFLLMLLFAATRKKTGRVEGAVCVLIYVAYTAYIIMRAYSLWIF